MAIRQIRIAGDPILNKVCKEVKEVTPMIKTLIDDMLDTMYEANGVGLAAPQVGVLRRIAVVDIGDGPIVLINPQIIAEEGEQTGDEACLSLPGKAGEVKRPNHVVVRALDENMTEYEMEADELLARAFCHEIEHLDGHMYMERVIGDIHDAQMDEE
ncbi:MAG: peptide deformylase [Eubacterium sp.]|jgi:peptide deformylase|nr:peptide deformylase [Eubacterium sp.]